MGDALLHTGLRPLRRGITQHKDGPNPLVSKSWLLYVYLYSQVHSCSCCCYCSCLVLASPYDIVRCRLLADQSQCSSYLFNFDVGGGFFYSPVLRHNFAMENRVFMTRSRLLPDLLLTCSWLNTCTTTVQSNIIKFCVNVSVCVLLPIFRGNSLSKSQFSVTQGHFCSFFEIECSKQILDIFQANFRRILSKSQANLRHISSTSL